MVKRTLHIATFLDAAEEQRDRALSTAYAARLTPATSAIDGQNGIGEIDILESLIPKPGEHDVRGFEWYYLWKRLNDEELAFFMHSIPLTGLSAHPSEPIIASVGVRPRNPDTGSSVLIWNAETGALIKEIPGQAGGIQTLPFSPDGEHLATGGLNDGTIRLWRWRSGELEWAKPLESRRPATIHYGSKVRVSPDGRTAALSESHS